MAAVAAAVNVEKNFAKRCYKNVMCSNFIVMAFAMHSPFGIPPEILTASIQAKIVTK